MRNQATAVYRPKNGLSQTVAISGTSAASSTAFADQTRIITLDSDTGCHVHFAGTPTATTADFHMVAGWVYQFIVNPGQKVAVITDASAINGTLWINEVTF